MPPKTAGSKSPYQLRRDEARQKALQYKKELQDKKSKASPLPKRTPPKKQIMPSSPSKTPKSVGLARAKAYGDKLTAKKGSPLASRAPVFSVSIPAESEVVDSFSQTSGSFETAATQSEPARVRELKVQLEKWIKARDDIDEEIQRLRELIDEERHAMDLD